MRILLSSCNAGVDYLVIARKYRPQTFTDVIGQDLVSRTLTNAIRSHHVHHAYIFTGPRGVGKTSMARILAKALCCESGPTTEPCGVCDHCVRITDSTHPDVTEIDAARFNGVDAIRELADGAVFAPSLARKRVYLLDEVHMLSPGAWNALLKLLEEPPKHVQFIFATTDIDKVLPTVQSRCQRFDFRSLEQQVIADQLAAIAAKEGRSLPPAIATRLARAASGGMRDGQTLLDQLMAVTDGEVGEDDLDLLLGAARGEDLHACFAHLMAGRSSAALETIERVCAGGVSPATFLDQVTDLARGVLLVQACGRESPAVRKLGLDPQLLQGHAEAGTPEKTLRICQVLLGTQQHLRHGADARLQLEIAAVRIARFGDLVDVDRLLTRLERLEAAGPR